jgi:hypothetical protein
LTSNIKNGLLDRDVLDFFSNSMYNKMLVALENIKKKNFDFGGILIFLYGYFMYLKGPGGVLVFSHFIF